MLQLKFIARLCQRAPELNLPKSDILRTSILAGRALYPLEEDLGRSRVDLVLFGYDARHGQDRRSGGLPTV